MTREILFRGKLEIEGKWLHGDLVHTTHDKICIVVEAWMEGVTGGGADLMIQDYLPVDPETVGQFTSGFDGGKRKIFKGDILKFTEFYNAGGMDGYSEGDRQHILPVEWSDDQLAWIVGDFLLSDVLRADGCSEVIGNIHDNPELLEAKNAD